VVELSAQHSLWSRPNITTWMIYWILESREDHKKWLTENHDTFLSDELSS
jgi:hypothetical protein